MTLLMREREKYKEGITDGVIRSAVQTCKNFNLSFQEIVQYLMATSIYLRIKLRVMLIGIGVNSNL